MAIWQPPCPVTPCWIFPFRLRCVQAKLVGKSPWTSYGILSCLWTVLGNNADCSLTLSSAGEPEATIILLLSATVAARALKRQGPRKKSQPPLLRNLGHSERGRVSDLLGNGQDWVIKSQIGGLSLWRHNKARERSELHRLQCSFWKGFWMKALNRVDGGGVLLRMSGVVLRWWPYSSRKKWALPCQGTCLGGVGTALGTSCCKRKWAGGAEINDRSLEPGSDYREANGMFLDRGKTEPDVGNLRLYCSQGPPEIFLIFSLPKCGSWYLGTALKLSNKQLRGIYSVPGALFLNKYIILQ